MRIGSSVASFFKAVFSPDMMNAIPKGEKLLGPRPDKQKLHDDLMAGREERKPGREPHSP